MFSTQDCPAGGSCIHLSQCSQLAHAVFTDSLLLSFFNPSTKAEGFLLPPGSGAQVNTCLPTPLHSAIFPFVFCLKQLSPTPEAGTWCLQAMTGSQHRESLQDFLPISVTGKSASIEVSPWCGLGPSQEPPLHLLALPFQRLSLCLEARPLVCPSSLGGLLCQGRNPVPSGSCLGKGKGVRSMPASHGPIKVFRGYQHWKDYGAPSHTEFKMEQQETSKHKTYLPSCCD